MSRPRACALGTRARAHARARTRGRSHPRCLRSCAALALPLLLLCTARPGVGHLQSSPSNCAANPLAGQGDLPDGHRVDSLEVETAISSVSLIAVDETKFIASLYLGYQLVYDDPASVAAMQANYTGSCSLYCSAQASFQLNSVGNPACCDGVFIPQAEAINSKRYYVQQFAERWMIRPESDARVSYYRSLQGAFEVTMQQGAFPFDRHYILVDIQTAFKPVLPSVNGVKGGAGFSLVDGFAQQGARRRVTTNPQYYRPAISAQSLPAWSVLDIFMEVLELRRKFTKDIEGFEPNAHEPKDSEADFLPLPLGQWRAGQPARYAIRVYIEVQRRSTGFWVMTSVLPVALVTIFGFGVQSLPRQALKARTELLSTLFLSLVLLQTVLYQFLPPLYFLALPLQLVLVGYVYTLLLFVVIIAAQAQEGTWRRRQLQQQRRWASQTFSWWAERLQAGPGAQAALSLSAARHAVPFDVAQVMAPLDGSRADKHRPDTRGEPEMSDAAREVAWLQRHAHSWYWCIPPVRALMEWHKFTGLIGSQQYCSWVANRFDQGARIVLLLTYVAVVVGLCLWTVSRRNALAAFPFPA